MINNVGLFLQANHVSLLLAFCFFLGMISFVLFMHIQTAHRKTLYLDEENKKIQEQLRFLAFHDSLTGLANRNKFLPFINDILTKAAKHHTAFALLFLDLDRFKRINDTFGHEAGDKLLQVVGQRLQNYIEDNGMVSRLAGDEFVLLINDIEKVESIERLAQHILSNIRKVILLDGEEIYITTSIGISFYPYDGETIPILMKNADLALYHAKKHGRNNYKFYKGLRTNQVREKEKETTE